MDLTVEQKLNHCIDIVHSIRRITSLFFDPYMSLIEISRSLEEPDSERYVSFLQDSMVTLSANFFKRKIDCIDRENGVDLYYSERIKFIKSIIVNLINEL